MRATQMKRLRSRAKGASSLGAACLFAAACSGQEVTLGEAAPPPFRFGTPTRVLELAAPGNTDNPTLTADMLEIYFTSDRDVGGTSTSGDVWVAKRSQAELAFEAPSPVAEVNSASFETSSAISADGLTLWLGSDRAGGAGLVDVWVSTRGSRTEAWSAPRVVPELNTALRDVPRPLGLSQSVMPLASERDTPQWYSTFFAQFHAASGSFERPVSIPSLAFPNRTTVDAFLTDDGAALFYSSAPPNEPSDLYVAFRKSTSGPFVVIQALDDLNTSFDDRDPFLGADGTHFFFTSNRDGSLAIYEAELKAR